MNELTYEEAQTVLKAWFNVRACLDKERNDHPWFLSAAGFDLTFTTELKQETAQLFGQRVFTSRDVVNSGLLNIRRHLTRFCITQKLEFSHQEINKIFKKIGPNDKTGYATVLREAFNRGSHYISEKVKEKSS